MTSVWNEIESSRSFLDLALSGDKDLELELDSGLDSFVKGIASPASDFKAIFGLFDI